MALLPTGFGKSLIYQLAPIVAGHLVTSPGCPDRLKTANFPIVIVLSPLVALINDQVKAARRLGLTAVSLGDASAEELRDVVRGKFQLVFGNPETWVLSSKWRDMLRSEVYQDNLLGLVVDEAHKTPAWGEAVSRGGAPFRTCFGRVSELRSLCKYGTPVLALTASAELPTRKDIVRLLSMNSDTTFVEANPDRPNIRLGVVRVKGSDLSCLDWIVTGLKEQQTSFPKVIIYVRSFNNIGAVFGHFKRALGDAAYVGKKHSTNRLFAVYCGETLSDKKEHVMQTFVSCPDSTARVVIATTALSMGVNFPDVKYVVIYGPPESMEDIMQEVGRAGRSGEQSHAVIYSFSLSQCSKAVSQYVRSDKCLRIMLYDRFQAKPTTKSIDPGHLCCSNCHKTCKCDSSKCKEPLPSTECKVEAEETEPSLKRSVSDHQRDILREALYEYRDSLVHSNSKLLISFDLTTGFSHDLIKHVLDKCEYIFTPAYVESHLPVFGGDQAQVIVDIVRKVFDEQLDIDSMLEFVQKEFAANPLIFSNQDQLLATFTSSSDSSGDDVSSDDIESSESDQYDVDTCTYSSDDSDE
ncbi:putative ATP-dependent DNA helicase Q1 [Branchiostoma floridae]|uniref:DNA 3'-5' helicase n=1 Tax=Branchiostoma floridae TaxID=7739 RepID=A0A9J7LUG0_BRAFL|nr:putative ATP-dependent DNA helicase Q1 [Branchiostoma floridae]